MPAWLNVHHIDDLKANLVSVVIAVLGVLFLREAVALVIASPTFYLGKDSRRKE